MPRPKGSKNKPKVSSATAASRPPTTATADRPAAATSAARQANRKPSNGQPSPQAILDIPCEFGGLTIGDAVAKLSVTIRREVLNIDAADEALCGRRLTGRIIVIGADVDPKQTHLIDDLHPVVESSFDVKSFRVSPKLISTGLSFAIAPDPDQDGNQISTLAHFAKKSGRLTVFGIGNLGDAEAGEDSDESSDDDGEVEGV